MDPVNSSTSAGAPPLSFTDPLSSLFPTFCITCVNPRYIDPGIGIQNGREQRSADYIDQYVAIGKRDAAKKAQKRREQINRKIRHTERSYIRGGAQPTPAPDVASSNNSQPPQPTAFLYPSGCNWECEFCLCLIPKHSKRQHVTSLAHISVIDSIFPNDQHSAGNPLNAILADADLPGDPRSLTRLSDMSQWLEIYSRHLVMEERRLAADSLRSSSLDDKFDNLINPEKVDTTSSHPVFISVDESPQRSRGPSSAMRAVMAAETKIEGRLEAKRLRESDMRENVVRRQSVRLTRAFPRLVRRRADPRGRGGKR